MKSWGLMLAGMVLLGFAGCGGGSTGKPPVPAIHNEWAWVNGSNVTGYQGFYGTQGVPAASNRPGGHAFSVSWTDADGNLWLFGGLGVGSNYTDFGNLNDLWKYDPATNIWTWVGGSDQTYQPGVYGTQGVASADNVPGARDNAVRWTDADGNFWLFGGIGTDSVGSTGELNDLWKYSPTTNMWTWMGGSNIAAEPGIAGAYQGTGVYGTKGVAAPGNLPGTRFAASAWTDASGNFWLFGGEGVDSNGMLGEPNDLWKYSPTTNMWTWMSGSNLGAYQPGVYGTQGVAAPANVPGSRTAANTWTDASGNLWLFGGMAGYNDLWKYSPATNTWTWMGGPDQGFQPGVYGTKGVAAPGNLPWFRDSAVSWTDAAGNFWLFGGEPDAPVDLNDLWKYSPATNLWTWMNGSDNSCPANVYGTFKVFAPGNTPGGRVGGASWTDKSGNLWFFGGDDFCTMPSYLPYNDLWEYQP
ncbi:MAG: kelch repeat-containing protein [Acidobacteriaceae bacterium]